MSAGRLERWRNGVADGVSWAIAGAVVVVALLSVLSLASALAAGTRLLTGVKLGLFMAGWLAMGAGTLLLRPKRYEEMVEEYEADRAGDRNGEGGEGGMGGMGGEGGIGDEDGEGGAGGTDGVGGDGLVADEPAPGEVAGVADDLPPPAELVQQVPPARWLTIPEDDRLPDGARLLFVGAGLLALSFLMELAGIPG